MINQNLLDELLKDYQKPEDILGDNGLLKQLTKAVLERAMQAELTHHLGYDKHDPKGNATFEPQIVPKGQTRFEGFDDKILFVAEAAPRRSHGYL